MRCLVQNSTVHSLNVVEYSTKAIFRILVNLKRDFIVIQNKLESPEDLTVIFQSLFLLIEKLLTRYIDEVTKLTF